MGKEKLGLLWCGLHKIQPAVAAFQDNCFGEATNKLLSHTEKGNKEAFLHVWNMNISFHSLLMFVHVITVGLWLDQCNCIENFASWFVLGEMKCF